MKCLSLVTSDPTFRLFTFTSQKFPFLSQRIPINRSFPSLTLPFFSSFLNTDFSISLYLVPPFVILHLASPNASYLPPTAPPTSPNPEDSRNIPRCLAISLKPLKSRPGVSLNLARLTFNSPHGARNYTFWRCTFRELRGWVRDGRERECGGGGGLLVVVKGRVEVAVVCSVVRWLPG